MRILDRKMAALGLVLAAAVATPAFAQSFLGQWTATAHLDGGAEVSEALSVTKTATGFSITAKPPSDAPQGAPQAGPGTNIALDGDKFSYDRSIDVGGGNTLVINYSGVVSGDSFTGTAKLGDTPIPYTGVRVK
jgi:hypothetical protein